MASHAFAGAGGGRSAFGGIGGGGLPPLSAPPNLPGWAQSGEDSGTGVLGFFGNLLGDVRDVALGAGGAVLGAGGDIVQLFTEPFHGMNFDPKRYHTWQLVTKGPGAIAHDVTQRYGSGWHNFFSGLYEHPLSFGLDAATIATAGGAGAARAAALSADAAKIGELARGASAAAAVGDTSVSAAKLAEATKLAEAAPSWAKRVLPGLTGSTAQELAAPGGIRYGAEFQGGQLALTPRPDYLNPLTRATKGRVLSLAGQTRTARAAALVGEGISERIGLDYAPLVQRAQELGLGRVDRPLLTKALTARAADRLVGRLTGGFYRLRNQTIREIGDMVHGLSPNEVAALDAHVQGLADPITARRQLVPAGVPDAENVAEAIARPGLPPGLERTLHMGGDATPPEAQSFDLAAGEVPAQPYEVVPADSAAAQQLRFDMSPQLVGHIGESTVDSAGEVLHQVEEPDWVSAATDAERAAQFGRVLEVRNTVANPDPALGRGVFVKVQTPQGQVVNLALRTPKARMLDQVRQVGQSVLEGIEDPVRREMGQAWLDSLEEPVTAELRSQLGGVELSSVEQAGENFRTFTATTLEQDMMLRHGYTPDQLLEAAYLPQRMASGAKFDRDLNEWVGGEDTLTLHRARQQAGLATPVYFPKYDATRVRYSDFLLSRRLVGSTVAAKHPGYLKQNRGYLLEKGLYERDPVEAYGRRATVALKSREQFELYNQLVQRFGRRMKDANDFVPGVEMLTSPELLHRYFRNQVKFNDALMDAVFSGEEVDRAAAESLRNVAADSLQEIADRLGTTVEELGSRVVSETLGVTKNGVELWALPRTVAERFQASAARGGSRTARLFFQKPLQVWRAWTLNGSPRWMVNNAISNVMFLKLQGGKLSDVVRQFDPKFRAMLDAVIPEEANLGFHAGYEYQPRLGSAARSSSGRLAEATAQSRPIVALRRARDFMGRLNTGIEDAFRKASYLKGLDRATAKRNLTRAGRHFWNSKRMLEDVATHGVTPEVAEQATREMTHFFGDYSAMTPFEKNVIRPYIAPFWAWYRHVARLVVGLPFEYPGRAELLRLWSTAGNELNAQFGPLPDWMQGALIYSKDPEGRVKYLSTQGSNPFSTFAQMLDPSQAISMLNPIVKTAYEQATGRDVFGSDFTDQNVISPFGSSQQFRINPATGQATPVDRVAPGLLESILRNFPQYQTAENLLSGGAATYDTANLLSLARGQGVIRDASTGAARYPGNPAQPLLNWLGIPSRQMDLQSYQQRQAEDALAAMREWMARNPA